MFQGVLPLPHGNGVPELTLALAKSAVDSLRRATTGDSVFYATWVAESWRVLGWSEPLARLFWEFLSLYHASSPPGALDELPISDLAIYLLLHVPEFIPHSPRLNPAPNVAFDESWPAAPPAVHPGNSGSGRRSPIGSPSRLGSPISNGGAGDSSSSNGNLSPVRSPSSARTLCLAAAAAADAHRLGFVRQHCDELVRLVSSDPKCRQHGDNDSNSDGTALESPSIGAVPSLRLTSTPSMDFTLTRDDVNKLGFLVCGGALDSPLPQLSLAFTEHWGPGDALRAATVVAWLTRDLTVNDHLYPPLPGPSASGHFSAGDRSTGSPPTSPPRSPPSSQPPHLPLPSSKLGLESCPLILKGPNRCHEGTSLASGSPLPPRVVASVHRLTVIVRDEEESPSSATGSEQGQEGSEGAKLPLRDCAVHHCSESHLYLLEPYRFVSIVGCSGCTIVVGAVCGVVRVVGCERVTVVTACRRLLVSSCTDATFPVFCATNPILAGDNRSCYFAPYNTAYQELKHLLRRAHLPTAAPPALNMWNAPLDASTLAQPTSMVNSDGHAKCPSVVAGLLQPHLFTTLTVPIRSLPDQPLPPLQNPFSLPPEYSRALTSRLEAATTLTHTLGRALVGLEKERQEAIDSTEGAAPDTTVTDNGNEPKSAGAIGHGQEKSFEGADVAIESALRAHFADWLGASGQLREILDLAALDRARYFAKDVTEVAVPEINEAIKP